MSQFLLQRSFILLWFIIIYTSKAHASFLQAQCYFRFNRFAFLVSIALLLLEPRRTNILTIALLYEVDKLSVVNIGLGGRYISDISLIGGRPIRYFTYRSKKSVWSKSDLGGQNRTFVGQNRTFVDSTSGDCTSGDSTTGKIFLVGTGRIGFPAKMEDHRLYNLLYVLSSRKKEMRQKWYKCGCKKYQGQRQDCM